ncbi:MAG: hypothetical protein V3W31_01425, partial [Thermodesulfobacteriota bacterium]
IDYVIFEFVPTTDWTFETARASIENAIKELKKLGLAWSFLIDVNVCPPNELMETKSRLGMIEELIRYIESRGWDEGLVTGPTGRPLMFVFFPVPADAIALIENFSGKYEMRFPVYMPHWGRVDEKTNFTILNPFTTEPGQKGITLHEYLTPMNYISFSETTEKTSSYNGFCSVMPGYDDSLLNRSPLFTPKVEREGGENYRRRFKDAIAHRPDHIIIYGWNEYFETTNIEPTEEYGMLYVDITKEMTAAIKR